MQEELENIRKGCRLSNGIISGESCSIMEMKSSSSVVFVDEEEEGQGQQIMKCLEEERNKIITSDDFMKMQREDREMNNEEEQQMMLYASYNYDPILTHITSSSNYDYFGDYYYYNHQLEQLSFSVDELFPSFWS